MTTCPRCGAEIIRGQVTQLDHRAFDAVPGGTWSLLLARSGSRWATKASLGPRHGGYEPHACPGETGEQLELDA